MSVRRDVVCCPQAKRGVVLATARAQHDAATSGDALDGSAVARLIGRLTNLSQAFPRLLEYLHDGYAVAAASAPSTRFQRRRPPVTLRVGSHRQRGFAELLDVTRRELEANEGLPLVTRAAFPGVGEPGVLTVVTDASGDDGVGGFAFHPSRPRTVFVVSEPWSPEAAAGLAVCATPHAQRTEAQLAAPRLSMPAAECFGSHAVAAAVTRALPLGSVSSVIAIGDCRPSALAIRKGKSRSPLLNAVLQRLRSRRGEWLGVAVKRHLNRSADVLSHPADRQSVIDVARRAQLESVSLDIPSELWAELHAAMRRTEA